MHVTAAVDLSVAELIGRRAGERPEAVAIEDGARRLTYAELDAAAGRIAAGLRGCGAGDEEVVGVCLPRSWQAVCAFLGALRAGCAYLPLDPGHPPQRRRRLLELADARRVIGDPGREDGLPPGVEALLLDALLATDAGAAEPPAPAGGGRLASVLFTSGSTGVPKGIEITHANLSHVLTGGSALVPEPADSVLGVAPTEFDLSAMELWGCLTRGAKLVLAPAGRPDPAALGRLIAARGVTYALFAAGLFEQVARVALADLAGMRLIATAGDVMPPAAAGALRRAHPQVRLFNAYGPAETTIVASSFEVDEVDGSPLPIGKPLPGCSFHILDPDGDPVPSGTAGELWIGGAGVARGYRGEPVKTVDRFRPDPLASRPGARMYGSGDIVRLREDGELMFLGRIDDQVKIAGHRIEPGEVERALGIHPDVRHAAVLAREDVPGHKRLVGYVSLREGSARAPALLEHLAELLPAYMLPATIEVLPELPLTPRGKVDRAALPAPRRDGEDEATNDATAARVAATMADLLGLERVGPDEDFFALGADSLLAIHLVGRLRERLDARLDIDAVFDGRTARGLAQQIQRREGASPRRPPLRPSTEPGPAPASFAQRRAWLFERTNPGSLAYQFACVVDLRGELDEGALAAALGELMRRHEVLRTAIVERGGEPVQVVHDDVPLPLERADLRGESDVAWASLLRRRVRTRIELGRAPLIRWTLVRRAQRHWSLIDVEHHAAHDGWSFTVMQEELAELYSARVEGRAAELPEVRVQLSDFARWERTLLDGELERRQLDHWRRTLDPDPPLLELPFERQRGPRESFAGGSIRRRLDPELAERARQLANEEGATLFMACLAAFALLLSRVSGQDRIQTGSGLANRSDPAADRLVGMTVATVALQIDLGGDPSVRELLRRVRGAVLGAVANSDVPFERVVEALAPPRHAGRSPLVQTLFSFDDAQGGSGRWAGLDARVVQTIPNGTAKADLNVIGVDHGEGVPFFIWEHSELLSDAAADRLAAQHLSLLERLVARPDARLSELDPIGEEERLLLDRWNAGGGRYDRDATVNGLVEARAREDPGATAVLDGAARLTYAELVARAHAVAAALREHGVERGDRVGVLLGRSAAAVTAQLGALAAGAAYVPLDPQFPAERTARLLAHAGVEIVLTGAPSRGSLPVGITALSLDEIAKQRAVEAAPVEVGPEDLAYVICTSGSTGEPKGVEVTHRNVVRLVDAPDYAELGAGTVMLHAASPAFDATTLEIWGPLANGGAIACLGERPSPDAVAAAVEAHGVTTLWLTSGLFNELVDRRPDCLAGVRQVLAGGEALSPDHVRRALAALPRHGRLTNGYGPTETTTFATTHELRPGDRVGESVPIGLPIQGTACHVLDSEGRELPVGVVGELAIGGDGVARGYRDDPELTAARFRPDPERPGDRLYLSGDRVRRRPDGALEFLGRSDRQLKLRGVRVEPAEVESVLRSHPAVADAAVVPFERTHGGPALVAYVVAAPGSEPPSPAALRAHASSRLPAAMVPAASVVVPALPLTANGKLDRNRLPAPEREHLGGDGRAGGPPRDERERRVVSCFEAVLGVTPVGPEDDFFALGGHSLLALSVLAELERIGGRRLPLSLIFEAPTPRRLAAQLGRETPSSRWDNLVPLKPHGSRPPLFAVAAGDGNIVGFAPLARCLAAEQPLYALQPSGLDGRRPLDSGIEAMAGSYLAALRRVQPRGPYLLAGRCNGATVAFEMAQRLRAAGEDVPLLAALDSDPPPAGPFELAPGVPYDQIMEIAWLRARDAGEEVPDIGAAGGPSALAAWLRAPAGPGVSRYLHEAWRWRDDLRAVWPDPLGADGPALTEWAWDHGRREHDLAPALLLPQLTRPEGMRGRTRRLRALGSRRGHELAAEARARMADALERRLDRPLPNARARTERRVVAAARQARAEYRAQPWPGRIVVVTSTEFADKPPYLAWQARAAEIDRRHLSVGHVEMLREPGVGLLAQCLEECISEALEG